MPTSNLYELLPAYVRLFDDDEKIVKFICDAIQPEIELQLKVTRQLPDYFDLDNGLSWERLDWLGQLVGLGAIEGHHLGIGINPNWTIPQKVKLIRNVGEYWKQKGTEPGIRRAIELWLHWEQQRTKLNIRSPFTNLSGWWEYGTPYDFNEGKPFGQQKAYGGGDYQHPYQPAWELLTPESSPAPEFISKGSGMGARNIWMEFEVDEAEWRSLFPDYHTLALEIFPVTARQHPIIYFDLGTAIADIPRIPNNPSDGVLIDFDVDGYQYYWEYPYPAVFTPEPYTETETIVTQVPALAGFEYGHPWGITGRSIETTTEITIQVPADYGFSYGDNYGGIITTSTTETETISYDTTSYSANYGLEYGGVWAEVGEFTFTSEIETITPIASKPWSTISFDFVTAATGTEIIQPLATLPWTANPQTFTETITTTIVPEEIISCSLGVTASIETGEETIIETTPAVLSDFWLEVVDESTETTTTPSVPSMLGWEWGYEYTVDFAHLTELLDPVDNELVLDSIAPVDGLFMAELIVNTPIDKSDIPVIPWNYLGTEATTETITIPGGVILRSPHVAQYNVEWGGVYPFWDSPAINTEVTVPVFTDYQICNVPANWTSKTIIRYQEIILPPAELDIPIAELYPELPVILNGNNWQLLIETSIGLISQKPTNIFLRDEDDHYLPQATGMDGESLYLEFSLMSIDCLVSSFTLMLVDRVIKTQGFTEPLDWSRQTGLSISSSISLNYLIPA